MHEINSEQSRQQKPPAILLMGPTASGKTALAQKLCDEYPCDIINVDSAQFYKGMNIGTAKPDEEELAAYPHRLLSFLDPTDHYSVAQFQKDVLIEIEDILAQNRIPLLVGGSMMYFKVLVEGMSHLPETDKALRKELEEKMQEKGLVHMHRWLKRLDPQTAERLHMNDTQRILRALEVCLSGEKTMSQLLEQGREVPEFPCRWVQIGLFPENRALLHERIEVRFKQMLEQGFVAEVEKLYKRPDIDKNLPALRAVGYKQVWEYLDGALAYENMQERGIIATRQFAKRQYTWLRSWKDIQFFDNSRTFALSNIEREKVEASFFDEVIGHLNQKL